MMEVRSSVEKDRVRLLSILIRIRRLVMSVIGAHPYGNDRG